MSHWDFSHPTDGQQDRARRDAWPAPGGWPPGSRWYPAGDRPPGGGTSGDGAWPGSGGDEDDGAAPYPLTYERDDYATAGPQPAAPSGGDPWQPWAGRDRGLPDEGPGRSGGEPGPLDEDLADGIGGARRGGRRWLLPAGAAMAGAAVGAAAVLLAGGHAGTKCSQPAGSAAFGPVRARASYPEQFAAYDPPST